MAMRHWRAVWAVAAVGATLALLAFVALPVAWLVSNWRDAPPQPEPAELSSRASAASSPPATNHAHAVLSGLQAAAERDPATVGQTLWQADVAFWRRPRAEREQAAVLAAYNEQQRAGGELLPHFSPACPDERSCVVWWMENEATRAALMSARAHSAVVGQRCEALLDGEFQFEEPTVAAVDAAGLMPTHLRGALACSRWFVSGTVLAARASQMDEALLSLRRLMRLQQGLLAGSHSLIAQTIAWRLAREGFNAVTLMALQVPPRSAELQALLPPAPDSRAALRRWVRHERQYARASLGEALSGCLGVTDLVPNAGRMERALDGVSRFACRHHIGLHPNRLQQSLDRRWLALLQARDAGWALALAPLRPGGAAHDSDVSIWRDLHWVNTWGEMLVSVMRGAHADYLARQADVDLHHETTALVLALQAQGVPAAERAAWAARQPVSDTLRERLQWADGGRRLDVRTWQQDQRALGAGRERESIGVAWPL